MKKILLTLAAMSIVTGVWAQDKKAAQDVPETYIDVTPSVFRFNKADLNKLDFIREDLALGAANINNSLIQKNINQGLNYFTTETLKRGNLVIGGGYNGRATDIKKGFSVLNLGDEIGQVLVLNGKNSTLKSALKSTLGVDVEGEIPSLDALDGNFQLFWINDFLTMNNTIPENTKIRFRVELNGYHNDMKTDLEVFNGLFVMNDQANAFGAQNGNIKFNEFADENGEWDPYHWMVYEQETTYNRLPTYIKMFFQLSTGGLNNGSILFRNLEIYGLPSSDYSSGYTPNTVYKSWNDYSSAYAPIQNISLAHGQEGDFELSGGENAELTFSVTPVEGYDPATVFSVATTNNDAAHVSFSEVREGKFTVSVNENAVKSVNPVKISVTAGDVKSNEVELNHFAAPSHVALGDHETLKENEISLYANQEAVEYKIIVVSKLDSKEGAYQKFVLKSDANNFADISLNDAGDAVVVTPKAAGKASFTLTPLKAGEAKASAEPSADATTYTVTIGTTGIESIEVNSGEVEYFNLNGVKVANPEKGVFIKKQGNKSSKVVL